MLEVLPLKIETRTASVSTFVHNKERLKKKKMKSESIGKKTNNKQKKNLSLSADNIIVFRENPEEFHIYGIGICIS